MIFKIWTRIFLILLLATLPLMAAQYFLQKQSIELVFEVVDKNSPPDLIDSHLQLLKKISQIDPKHTEDYRKEFEKTVENKIAREDISLIRESLIHETLIQTFRNTLIVLAVFLAFSFWLSKGIVDLLKRLMRENQTHSSRLEKLGTLESWQRVARMLVHELRAPITPIKLVSTDIEEKYASLPPPAFQSYLCQGAELIRTQVASIERLMESFIQFAKLPDIKKSPRSIRSFIEDFAKTYGSFKPGAVELSCQIQSLENDEIHFDPALLERVLFNLLKNAAEANHQQEIRAKISLKQDPNRTWIRFANDGVPIPESLASHIFDLYASGKPGEEGPNLGMGLTISRKIALDHGGDLQLVANDAHNGVIFEMELPNQ